MNWISVNDNLPRHGQHVLVCVDRFNVYPFPNGDKGDDGKGRARMGDAIYRCGETMWAEKDNKHLWDSKEEYKSMNSWDTWSGQGPCSFGSVTHWMPMPDMPNET